MSYASEYVIRNFKMYYKYLERDVDHFREDGPEGLIITMRDGSRLYYDDTDHTLRRLPCGDMSDEEVKREFGKRLLKIMRAKGLSQAGLASLSGISQPELSTYINGKRLPGFYNTYRIVNALHCSMDDLRYVER